MTNLPPHLQDVCDEWKNEPSIYATTSRDQTVQMCFQACYDAMVGDMLEFLNKIEDDCTDDYCCSGYTIEKFEKKHGIK